MPPRYVYNSKGNRRSVKSSTKALAEILKGDPNAFNERKFLDQTGFVLNNTSKTRKQREENLLLRLKDYERDSNRDLSRYEALARQKREMNNEAYQARAHMEREYKKQHGPGGWSTRSRNTAFRGLFDKNKSELKNIMQTRTRKSARGQSKKSLKTGNQNNNNNNNSDYNDFKTRKNKFSTKYKLLEKKTYVPKKFVKDWVTNQ